MKSAITERLLFRAQFGSVVQVKEVYACLGDITPQASLWLSSGPPQTTPSVSYADVAASQTSPSPTVRSAKRSVKVTAPVSNTQPKPILVSTPARAVLGPPTPGDLDPSDDMHTDFDADMLDPVDLVSSPPIPDIGRAPGTRGHGTVTIVAPQSGRKACSGWDQLLVVECLNHPKLEKIMKKIEDAAVPLKSGESRTGNPKLGFELPAEITLHTVTCQEFGPQALGSVQMFPASPRTFARLKGCDGLATPTMDTWRFPNREVYWGWRHCFTENYRLKTEYEAKGQ